MTVQQAKNLRDAVVKAREADAIFITFDNVGYALISAGKIKEGLAAYRQIAAQHPKEALHRVQMAQALLKAGLGEQARSVALQAATLEPSSAVAFSTLGLVLKNDLIGRPVEKGMDYEGAIAAYRKAIALDPKDKETRANLALLLEYDAGGTRYGEHARLKEAAAELRELKKVDEEYSRTYDDNVLYDLWYAHDYKGVLDYAATLPTSNVRKGLTLAAIALQQGTEAALKKSMEITTDDQGRSNALVTAGAVLVRVRKYAEGAVLFAEGARGQSNESQVMRSATIFNKTKPYEELIMDRADPRGVVQQLYGDLLSEKMTIEEFRSLSYTDSQFPGDPMDQKQLQEMMSLLKLQLGSTGLPPVTVADMAVSNMHFTVDGDDSVGYKVIIESPGAPTQEAYIVRDGDHYKVAGYSASGPPNLEDLAPLALRALEKNNLAAARKWLDRAREKIHVSGDDDPLAGPPFPYFWTKGQEADAATIRTAALVLLGSKDLKGPYLSALDQARQAAKTDPERSRLTMVLAYAYAAQEHWAEMLPLTQELMKSSPTSVRAFDLAVMAYTGLKRFDDWDKLVQARIQKYPDELTYVYSSATLALYRGDFKKSREILKAIIDKGQATVSDLNQYAWFALLLPGPIDQDTLDAAQRANELSENANYTVLHTVACIEAQAGRTSQAREMLLKAMDALHLEEPDPKIWFGFGMIAEQYGVLKAAEKMYERVEKPKTYYPGTCYVIAQQRLAALRKMANGSATTAGR
jgi:tetratricopeptide (TPR) repeat protein